MFVNMMLIVLMLLDTIDTALLLIVNGVIVTNQRVAARLTDRGNNRETMVDNGCVNINEQPTIWTHSDVRGIDCL